MSSEERQRELREAGSEPAEAEKQDSAKAGKEAKGKERAAEKAAASSARAEADAPADEESGRPKTPRRRRRKPAAEESPEAKQETAVWVGIDGLSMFAFNEARGKDGKWHDYKVLIPGKALVDVRLGGQYQQFIWSIGVQNLFNGKYYEYAISSLDFATGLPGPNTFALRLLPPGDGTGGLLVATSNAGIQRLDGSGHIVQSYNAPGETGWFALNLDPNGTSFWSGSSASNNFYRFNMASGAKELGPVNIGSGGGQLLGICLKGERTAAIPQTTLTAGSEPWSIQLRTVC